jgi:hypothetical protein
MTAGCGLETHDVVYCHIGFMHCITATVIIDDDDDDDDDVVVVGCCCCCSCSCSCFLYLNNFTLIPIQTSWRIP